MAITLRQKNKLVDKHLGMSQLEGLKLVDSRTDTRVLADNNLPIYVINTNYQFIDNDRGTIRTTLVISLDRPNSNSAPVALTIPSTWIPWPITQGVPKKMILESFEFRQAVAQGDIKLVDPDTAEAVLLKPEAAEEYSRIQHRLSAGDSTMAQTSPEDKPEDPRKRDLAHKIGAKRKKFERVDDRNEDEKLADRCSPAVVGFVSSIAAKLENNEEVTGPEVADFLIMNGDSMGDADMEFFTRQFLSKHEHLLENKDVQAELDEIAARLG